MRGEIVLAAGESIEWVGESPVDQRQSACVKAGIGFQRDAAGGCAATSRCLYSAADHDGLTVDYCQGRRLQRRKGREQRRALPACDEIGGIDRTEAGGEIVAGACVLVGEEAVGARGW